MPQDGDIVFHIGENAYVFEAVEPVKYTPLEDWISRGKNSIYCAKRLKDGKLSLSDIERMKQVGLGYKGKHYDLKFQWGDDRMYCSELIWKVFFQGAGIELCAPRHFSDFDISSPNVKKMIENRYGHDFDPFEIIVAPVDLFNSVMLEEIHY